MKIFNQNKDKLDFDFNYNNEETKNIKSDIMKIKSGGNQLSICDLRRISLRKLNRVMNVSNDVLESLTGLLNKKSIDIESQYIKDLINKLLESEGIGFPMLSTILKFLRPDIFPIIDIRAYRALYGKKISYYTIDKYIEYIKKVYEIRNQNNMKLEDVDQQLYEFDKKYNGKI